MGFCGEQTICINHGDHITGSRLRCRSWQCDECFPRRLSELRDLAASGYPDAFLTLTTRRGSYDSPDDAAAAMAKALRHLMQWIRRQQGWDRIPYLAIFEEHKSGWPHLHVLLRMPYVDQAELSTEWHRLTGSPIVDIRRIKSQRQASQYVAKYASKGPGRFDGCKRYWRTRHYVCNPALAGLDKPLADGTGWRQADPIEWVAWWYQGLGWTVGWESEDHWIGRKDGYQGGADPPEPPPPHMQRDAARGAW